MRAFVTYLFGSHACQVLVDTETGEVKVERYIACHDVGKAINPDQVLGQIQGGVTQGIGMVLMEEVVMKDGKIMNPGVHGLHFADDSRRAGDRMHRAGESRSRRPVRRARRGRTTVDRLRPCPHVGHPGRDWQTVCAPCPRPPNASGRQLRRSSPPPVFVASMASSVRRKAERKTLSRVTR